MTDVSWVGIVGGLICAIVLGTIFTLAFFRGAYHKMFAYTLLVFLIAAYAMVGSSIFPPVQWDLWSHYQELDGLRASSEQFRQEGGTYSHLPVSSLLFQLIAATPYNELLVSVAVLLSGIALLMNIRLAYRSTASIGFRHLGVIILLYLGFSNVLYTIAGVRNSMAVSLFCIGYTFEHGKSRRRVLAWLFYAAALLLHPAVGLLLAVRVLALVPIGRFRLLVAAAVPLAYGAVSSSLESSNLALFRGVGTQMSHYIDDPFRVDYGLFAMNLCFVLILALWRMMGTRDTELVSAYGTNLHGRFDVALFVVLLVSAATMPLLFNRSLYVLGYLLIPTVVMHASNARLKQFILVLSAAISVVNIYHQAADFYFTLR